MRIFFRQVRNKARKCWENSAVAYWKGSGGLEKCSPEEDLIWRKNRKYLVKLLSCSNQFSTLVAPSAFGYSSVGK